MFFLSNAIEKRTQGARRFAAGYEELSSGFTHWTRELEVLSFLFFSFVLSSLFIADCLLFIAFLFPLEKKNSPQQHAPSVRPPDNNTPQDRWRCSTRPF